MLEAMQAEHRRKVDTLYQQHSEEQSEFDSYKKWAKDEKLALEADIANLARERDRAVKTCEDLKNDLHQRMMLCIEETVAGHRRKFLS